MFKTFWSNLCTFKFAEHLVTWSWIRQTPRMQCMAAEDYNTPPSQSLWCSHYSSDYWLPTAGHYLYALTVYSHSVKYSLVYTVFTIRHTQAFKGFEVVSSFLDLLLPCDVVCWSPDPCLHLPPDLESLNFSNSWMHQETWHAPRTCCSAHLADCAAPRH